MFPVHHHIHLSLSSPQNPACMWRKTPEARSIKRLAQGPGRLGTMLIYLTLVSWQAWVSFSLKLLPSVMQLTPGTWAACFHLLCQQCSRGSASLWKGCLAEGGMGKRDGLELECHLTGVLGRRLKITFAWGLVQEAYHPNVSALSEVKKECQFQKKWTTLLAILTLHSSLSPSPWLGLHT